MTVSEARVTPVEARTIPVEARTIPVEARATSADNGPLHAPAAWGEGCAQTAPDERTTRTALGDRIALGDQTALGDRIALGEGSRRVGA